MTNTSTIGFLWPEKQTWGWATAKEIIHQLQIDCKMVAEPSQPQLLLDILKWTSEHAAAVIAYSNNLGPEGVTDILRNITKFTRTDTGWKQRLDPNQVIAFAQTSIKQCLIGVPGADISNISTLYAHKESRNQTNSWADNHLREGYEVIVSDSNGAAVNDALAGKDPTIAAIGPAFAVEDKNYVLRKGIDNNSNSETSFALIRNPNKELIVPRRHRHNGDFCTRIYGKIDPLHGGQVLFPAAIAAHGFIPYSQRTTNSPASWMSVKGEDIVSDSEEKLDRLIKNMQEWYPSLKLTIESDDFETVTMQWMRGGVPEFNHLWPAPLIYVR